jgi:hypothetical protein
VTKITSSSSDDWIYWHFGYTLSINYSSHSAIADLHNFQSTVAHALASSVSTIRLLPTDLKQETSISNHREVFLLFRLQSLWNVESTIPFGLTPQAYD